MNLIKGEMLINTVSLYAYICTHHSLQSMFIVL